MAGSSFGTLFQITTWGESHGAGIGVVVDGCPAGLSLSSSDIQVFLNRRKPGQTSYSTMRKEADEVKSSPASLGTHNRCPDLYARSQSGSALP